jgi:hypothetical protein
MLILTVINLVINRWLLIRLKERLIKTNSVSLSGGVFCAEYTSDITI